MFGVTGYVVDNVADTCTHIRAMMETSPSLFSPFMVLSIGSEPNLAQQSLGPNGVLRSMDMNLGSMDILDDFYVNLLVH